jgi:leucyl-tRNA---protein transferase
VTTHLRRDFAVPDFYITAPQPCPYVPGRTERKLFTHMSPDKPEGVIDNLLRNGFRRSQNIAYTPYCSSCQACVSVRVLAAEFAPNRSQRRTLSRNADVVAQRVPARPSHEQYTLFRDYVRWRHGDGGMSDMDEQDYAMMVGDSVIDTFMTEYRLRPDGVAPAAADADFASWPLVGVSLSDRLGDGISMVYSFFASALPERSLGTYMILENIAHVRANGLLYLYLGYWIRGSRKMSYKIQFRPQEHMLAAGWARQG